MGIFLFKKGCDTKNGVLKPNFSFLDKDDSVPIFFKASSLKSWKFFSFLKHLVKGWSGEISTNEAQNIVSGRVLKILILLFLKSETKST